MRLCESVVGVGAQDMPVASEPLAQTKDLTLASPGQWNLQATSDPGPEGLLKVLMVGLPGLRAWSQVSGFPGRGSFHSPPLPTPRAVQGEGCCERGLGVDSVGSCSGCGGGGDMALV